MSSQQHLVWSVLPNGVAGGLLRFSVVVSPRLLDGTTLADFPDWAATAGKGRTWPDTLTDVTLSLQFADLPGTPVLHATQVSTPSSTVWASRFPASTPVTSWTYPGYDKLKLRSYPMAAISDYLAFQYGKFGTESPTVFPSYAALTESGAFAPIGFEDDSTGIDHPLSDVTFGPRRKADLLSKLESMLAKGPIAPFADTDPASSKYNPTNVSYSFLQAETFLRRFLPPVISSPTPLTSPPPPGQDFAQLVGMAASMPTLLRYLGLVIDCTADPASLPGLTKGLASRVKLVVHGFSPLLGTTRSVFPYTQSLIGTSHFAAKQLASSDYADGMALIGNPALYRVVEVDPDSSAIKTMQFADTLTRSRKGPTHQKYTDSTPDSYSLPALRTGGFAFARTGRAVQMAETLARQRKELEDQATFTGKVTSKTPVPVLYADDLVRGVRIDVRDVADGVWRSLMWREADGWDPGDGTPVTLVEEDTVVPAPTNAPKGSHPNDLYLQDSLTTWTGWSLGVPQIGTPAQTGDPAVATPPPPSWTIPQWQVPGDDVNPQTAATNSMRLPRMRFGRSYQFRARTADLAGNGLTVAAAPTTGTAVTGAIPYLRFEPVEAPRLLLTAPHTPGESGEVLVIRSETLDADGTAALDNGSVLRLLIPGRSSVRLAEQHGAFDVIADTGDPMDSSLARYTDIAARDQAGLAPASVIVSSPADPTVPLRPVGEVYFNAPALAIDYLPDVLAHTAVVRGLPASGSPAATTAVLPFDTANLGWPQLQSCRIVLSRSSETSDPAGAPAHWSTQVYNPVGSSVGVVTTELDVFLPKGETLVTAINCQITSAELDLMAIRSWVAEWAGAHGKSASAALAAMTAGEHWMITPWRDVTFVHAVRTPLTPPVLGLFVPTRSAPGQTTVTFAQSSVNFHRGSTGRIDVNASWAMPVDTGSNPDPVTPVAFTAKAFGADIPRTGPGATSVVTSSPLPFTGSSPLTEIEQFNDTKYRLIAYQAIATSAYLEYFRQQQPVNLAANGTAVVPGFLFNAQTVELYTVGSASSSPRKLVAAPPGTAIDANPAPGDYVVGLGGAADVYHPSPGATIALLVNGSAAQALTKAGSASGAFTMTYVGPEIYSFYQTAGFVIPSTARPVAPDVRYVVPIYQRTTSSAGVTRTGGALRVYLNRPWWSSGDGELLGVVCCPSASLTHDLPPAALAPYVTQWGFDPLYAGSTAMPAQPTPANFPLRVNADLAKDWDSVPLALAETSGSVNVAAHEVAYDTTRGLWYCDIQMLSDGLELTSYMPLVRLALARFQPNSLSPLYLSKVVVTDFAQLAPDRYVTVTPGQRVDETFTYNITVTGRVATATSASKAPNLIDVTVEQQNTLITDDALAWSPIAGWPVFPLDAVIAHTDDATWTGTARVPVTATVPLRLTFQEYEVLSTGEGTQTAQRLVYTETFDLTS